MKSKRFLEVHIGYQVFSRDLGRTASLTLAEHWFTKTCADCAFEVRVWYEGKLIHKREALAPR
jgi:hypothetical protein